MTTNELSRLHEQDMADEERKVVDELSPWWSARESRLDAEKVENPIKERVRQYLTLNGKDEVVDQERGLRAWLAKPKRAEWWDVRPLTDEQIIGLARLGLLTVQAKAFDEMRKAAPSALLDAVQHKAGVRNEADGSRDLNIERRDA